MNELPEESVFVIPVLLAECVPPAITVGQVSFRDVHWYELYNRGVDDLIKYVRNFAELREKDHVDLGKRLVLTLAPAVRRWRLLRIRSQRQYLYSIWAVEQRISAYTRLVSRLLAVLTPPPKISVDQLIERISCCPPKLQSA
jgi:hypothetical protein